MASNHMNYIVDPETAEEAERLRIQGRYFDSQLGLLPREFDLATVEGTFKILDIGCGSGGWACTVANSYRASTHVTGVDISANMIRVAKARTIANQIPASFEVMDATRPLAFADASFDFVNARAICAFMQKTHWPVLVQECARLLRPGGYLRLVESDAQSWTSSPAVAEFYRLGHLALYQNGNSWDKEGVGVMSRLPMFLKRAGFEVCSNEIKRIDVGQGTAGYDMGVKDYKILLRGIIPLCVKYGIATKEDLEALYVQAMEEVTDADYNAFWFFTSIVGKLLP